MTALFLVFLKEEQQKVKQLMSFGDPGFGSLSFRITGVTIDREMLYCKESDYRT